MLQRIDKIVANPHPAGLSSSFTENFINLNLEHTRT